MNASLNPLFTLVYFVIAPDSEKAIMSDTAKQRLFSKMLPGKYFMKNVSMKKLKELIAHSMMLPIKFYLSLGSSHISL